MHGEKKSELNPVAVRALSAGLGEAERLGAFHEKSVCVFCFFSGFLLFSRVSHRQSCTILQDGKRVREFVCYCPCRECRGS